MGGGSKQLNTKTLLDCAIVASVTAGTHALKNFSRRTRIFKKFRHDIKLQLDIECQEKAEGVIRATFRDHLIMGEEDETAGSVLPPGDQCQWIIDPIDGTINFSHGQPLWCCSVAVRRGAKTLAGAVFAPMLNELYTATVDGPALCNGEKCRVSKVADMRNAIVFTGMDRHVNSRAKPLTILRAISERIQRARITGCAALDICRVAKGEGEGYFESGIYLWDIAAAGLLVRRAGGRTEVIGLRPPNVLSYLATNGMIHAGLKNTVKKFVSGHSVQV